MERKVVDFPAPLRPSSATDLAVADLERDVEQDVRRSVMAVEIPRPRAS
jgi:hypothetical protein